MMLPIHFQHVDLWSMPMSSASWIGELTNLDEMKLLAHAASLGQIRVLTIPEKSKVSIWQWVKKERGRVLVRVVGTPKALEGLWWVVDDSKALDMWLWRDSGCWIPTKISTPAPNVMEFTNTVTPSLKRYHYHLTYKTSRDTDPTSFWLIHYQRTPLTGLETTLKHSSFYEAVMTRENEFTKYELEVIQEGQIQEYTTPDEFNTTAHAGGKDSFTPYSPSYSIQSVRRTQQKIQQERKRNIKPKTVETYDRLEKNVRLQRIQKARLTGPESGNGRKGLGHNEMANQTHYREGDNNFSYIEAEMDQIHFRMIPSANVSRRYKDMNLRDPSGGNWLAPASRANGDTDIPFQLENNAFDSRTLLRDSWYSGSEREREIDAGWGKEDDIPLSVIPYFFSPIVGSCQHCGSADSQNCVLSTHNEGWDENDVNLENYFYACRTVFDKQRMHQENKR